MQWLLRTSDTFDTNTDVMSRPAAWATMAALVVAEVVILTLIINVLLGADTAFLAG